MLVGEVFARMGLDSKQYEKDLSRLEGVTRREATTLGAVFKNAFSVALGIGVFEAVKRGFQTIASTAISFNAQMEQARIGFTTMLGSAERADKFLRDVADFAARTPFEFPELLDASKRMLAYGFAAEDVLPTMEAVGNASAAVGLGAQGINRIILALGQIRAKGKLSAEEMRQLTETGIPAWEMLADAMGKTTAEIMDMQQKGLIPAHDAIQMIIEGMNKRFPGMMKKMENTWEGVTSTIKDVWRMTIGAVTEDWFNGLKTLLQGARDWAIDFYNIFREQGLQAALTHSFGAEFASAVSLAGSVLRGFFNVLKYVVGLVRRHWQLIKYTGTALLVYTAATKTASAATAVFQAITLALNGQLTAKIPLLSLVSTAMGIYKVQMALAAAQGIVLTGALAKLRVALYAIHTALGPIGWALLGLSLLVVGGMSLWNKYTQSLQKTPKVNDKIEDSTKAANAAIEDQAEALKAAGKAAAKNLQPFDEINQLQKEMAGGIGTDYLDAIDEALDLDAGGVGLPPLDFDEFLESLEEVKPTFKGFLDFLKKEAEKVLKSEWGPLVTGLLASPFTGAIHYISQHWGDIKDAFSEGMVNVGKLLSSEWAPLIVGLLISPFAGVLLLIAQKWKNINDVFDTGRENVQNLLQGNWGPILLGIFVSPFAGIITAIGRNLETIKKMFDFKLSLPKIKIPKFSVSWKTSGNLASVGKFLGLPGIPKISVSWLAQGGLITAPTLIGAGEAGREAVLPLDNNTGWADIIADRLATAMQGMQIAGAGAGGMGGGDIYVYIGNEQVDAYIHRSQDRRNTRSNGR